MQSSHPYPAERIQVIHVRGDDFEIGRQHAEAVGERLTQGMVKFYFDLWSRLSAPPKQYGWARGTLQRTMQWLVDPLLINYLQSRIPTEFTGRVRAMAQVSGHSYREMMVAVVLPDLTPMLQAQLARLRPDAFISAAPPRLGCSSFVARGHKLLHGRNLDFPGVGYWDRFPLIQCTHRSGGLRYIGFTTAVAPISGITGINEAGISVSLHQHYCREVSIRGLLPFVIGERILAEARDLDTALEIVRSSQVATSWAFIVVDGRRRRGFICESHPRAKGVRFLERDGDILAHSNFFQSPECRPAEYATSARMNWDNYWRKTQLENLVRQAGPELTPELSARLLSNHFDPYLREEKVFNRTVSQVYNIQSVVFDYDEMKVLMARGDSPVHLREYEEFDLGEIFSGREGRTGRVTAAYGFTNDGVRQAKEAYVMSFVAAFDGRYELALEEVRRSLQADFCPEAALVAGIVAMKLGNLAEGVDCLRRAKASLEGKMAAMALTKPPPEYFEISLYLARAHDLRGQRHEAQALYREVAGHAGLEDEHLRALARQEGPFTRAKLEAIVSPYSSYIPFQ